MKDIFLFCAVIAFLALGFFIMKKLDGFMENNRRRTDEDASANRLVLAFDNPMILDSLSPLFEAFSKASPDCPIHFLFGKTAEIYDALDKSRIDFGFIEHTACEKEKAYNAFVLSPEQNSIFCEASGCLLEPLNPVRTQTAVIRNKNSDNPFAVSFYDILLSFSKKNTITADSVQ